MSWGYAMTRLGLLLMGAVLLAGAVPALAQHRPEAWDTRVRTVGKQPPKPEQQPETQGEATDSKPAAKPGTTATPKKKPEPASH